MTSNNIEYHIEPGEYAEGGFGHDRLVMNFRDTVHGEFVLFHSGQLSFKNGGGATNFESLTFYGGRGNDYVIGGFYEDILDGGDGDDFLFGNAENDILIGGKGNDLLCGGPGYDILTGGDGYDRFDFRDPKDGADRITDFVRGEDKLSFTGKAFGINKDGDFMLENTTGHHNSQSQKGTFIFQSDTHELWFDVDGSGSQSAVLIATLDNTESLNKDDFLFY